MRTGRAGSGLSCRRWLVQTADAVIRRHSCFDMWTGTTHDARHQRGADSQGPFASVLKVRGSLIVKSGDFWVEFDEGGGLKSRCLERKKTGFGQLFASRILNVCGEVAERLKAAVC